MVPNRLAQCSRAELRANMAESNWLPQSIRPERFPALRYKASGSPIQSHGRFQTRSGSQRLQERTQNLTFRLARVYRKSQIQPDHSGRISLRAEAVSDVCYRGAGSFDSLFA